MIGFATSVQIAAGQPPSGLHSNFRLSPYQVLAPVFTFMAAAIGDVTADGLPDVVASCGWDADPSRANRIWVFPQRPDGSLGLPSQYPFGLEGDEGLVLADFNEDGVLDVAVGRFRGISLLLADAAGGLKPAIEFADADARTLGSMDVNRDGHADVISLGHTRGATVFLGDGTGGFPSRASIASPLGGRNDLEIAEVTGDSFADLVTLSGQGTGPDLNVHEHDGLNSFVVPPTSYSLTNLSPSGLGLGDVNGDGRIDAVVSAQRLTQEILVLLQNTSGAFDPPYSLPTRDRPQPVEVSDIDGDGTEDIVVAHDFSIGVYFQDPTTGALEPEVSFPIPYQQFPQPQSLAVGDISGDGCADVVLANDQLIVLRGQACGGALCQQPPVSDAGNAIESCTGDLLLLDGASSTRCPLSMIEYRWWHDAEVLCGWSSSPGCEISATPGRYTLEIRCELEPACAAISSVDVKAPPRPVVDAGLDVQVCGPSAITLTGSAPWLSCRFLYHWFAGATEACPESTLANCGVNLSATTTFQLVVACDYAPQCSGTDEITVFIDPGSIPGTLGNTLHAVKRPNGIELSWPDAPIASRYALHRSDQKGSWPPALRQGLTAPIVVEPDLASPPDRYYYRVAGESCDGVEGP